MKTLCAEGLAKRSLLVVVRKQEGLIVTWSVEVRMVVTDITYYKQKAHCQYSDYTCYSHYTVTIVTIDAEFLKMLRMQSFVK